MNEMERKLAEYRAKKARETKIHDAKRKAKEIFSSLWTSKEESRPSTVKLEDEENLVPSKFDLENEDILSVSSDDDGPSCFSYVDLLYYCLWFMFWAILYVIFIKLQFGTVYLVVSAIVLMYVNTRTGPKKNNEVSAYSVFNKNCESIDGTLKAEQFERELIYGPGAVH